MKKCPKRIMSALLAVVMLLALIPTQAFAASAGIEFKGYVTYGATTVGHFEVNGQQAFCLEHAKSSPQTGAGNSTSIYDDPRIIAQCH